MPHDFAEAVPYLNDLKGIKQQWRTIEAMYRAVATAKHCPECLREMWKELADGIDATLHDASIDWIIKQVEEARDA